MGYVAIMANSHKLFLFIRAAVKKALSMSKTICETDGSSIQNHQRRLACWMGHNIASPHRQPSNGYSGRRPVACYYSPTNRSRDPQGYLSLRMS